MTIFIEFPDNKLFVFQTSNGGSSGAGGPRPFSSGVGGINKPCAASSGGGVSATQHPSAMATQHQTPPNAGYRTHQWNSVGAGHQHPPTATTYYQRFTTVSQQSSHAAAQSQVVANTQQVQQQQAQSPAAQHPNSYNPNSSYNSNSVSIFTGGVIMVKINIPCRNLELLMTYIRSVFKK